MAKYDLAISFAGEQREIARDITDRLEDTGYSVFLDEYQEAELWGSDLTVKLGKVYGEEARRCLIIVSEDYVRKPWTNHERRNVLYRFMNDPGEYLLCLRTDASCLPGLPSVIGYLDLQGRTLSDVYRLLLEKLGKPDHQTKKGVSANDRRIALEIITACNRRALFAKTASELDLDAMYGSLGEAIGKINSLLPKLADQSLQFQSAEIVSALDSIEQLRTRHEERIACCLPQQIQEAMDEAKKLAIRRVQRLRRSAGVTVQLPTALRYDHFFGRENADAAPSA